MLLRLGPAQVYGGHGYFWFRLFGFGIHAKDRRRTPVLFSERHGYIRRAYIGPLSVGLLTPRRVYGAI